jgi:[ribosomal protein S5]-alanine N-acetyltransferase
MTRRLPLDRGAGPRTDQPALTLADDVVLRPWRAEDIPQLLLAQRDPAVRHYAGRLLEDRDAALAAMHGWMRDWYDAAGAAWAVTAPGNQILGMVRFGLIDVNLGTGSVGYWLLPEGRGRGIATSALRRTTPVVFRRLEWHRIELYHAVENKRSCGVARRSGYVAEGVMRSAMRYPADGRWSDEHLHARLVTDPDPEER